MGKTKATLNNRKEMHQYDLLQKSNLTKDLKENRSYHLTGMEYKGSLLFEDCQLQLLLVLLKLQAKIVDV